MEKIIKRIKSSKKMLGAGLPKKLFRKKMKFGIIFKIIMYILLLDFAFIYLYPFLHMIINSLKSSDDLMDISVKWVLNELCFDNFKLAFESLDYIPRFFKTLVSVGLCSVGHVLSCSFIGYGFARYNFRGKNIMFFLLMLSMVVPTQTIIVPLYILYSRMGMIPGELGIILPTFFGFGLNGALFVFIFRQFFLSLPVALEEAAAIDGCGPIKTFFRIAFPIAKPTVIISSVLSVVWHWNDFFEPGLYIQKQKNFYLSMMLPTMATAVENAQANTPGMTAEVGYTDATIMAAVILVIAPVFIGYIFVQRKFVQSVETSGITGE